METNKDNRAPITPLKSRPYDTPVSGPLTDKQIFTYCLQGRYGKDKQDWAEQQLKNRAAVKRELNGNTKRKREMGELLDDIL